MRTFSRSGNDARLRCHARFASAACREMAALRCVAIGNILPDVVSGEQRPELLHVDRSRLNHLPRTLLSSAIAGLKRESDEVFRGNDTYRNAFVLEHTCVDGIFGQFVMGWKELHWHAMNQDMFSLNTEPTLACCGVNAVQ